jgi:catechol 2,3-dioxygenase-like lactoylglutathione lyase family enzyme
VHVHALKTKVVTQLYDETLAFYAGLPGLALIERWDEPGDKGAILGFEGGAGEAFLEIYAGPAGGDFSGLSLQFRTDDADDFRTGIADRYACEGPVTRPWGSRYLYLVDPNGIRIIIYSGRY